MRRVELSKPPIAREVANYQTTVGLVLPGIGSEKFYLSSSALSDCSKQMQDITNRLLGFTWGDCDCLVDHLIEVKIAVINPLTLKSDQDRISPYNINTISSRQVMRIKKNLN